MKLGIRGMVASLALVASAASSAFAAAVALSLSAFTFAEEAATTEAPAAKPRTSADKEAAYEVVRTVVSVRCASIGVITVISVVTDGCSTVVAWTDADADRPLRVGVRRSEQGECQAGTENC